MIGVIADPSEQEVVKEFFELFKTPWEFYRTNQPYDVVISADGAEIDTPAKLIVVYSGRKIQSDDQTRVLTAPRRMQPCILLYRCDRIPIYGDAITFTDKCESLLKERISQECAAYVYQLGDTLRARIGYDLFAEIRTLLTAGQPHENASIPTLELHIAFLRDLMIECGISFVEIPPVPEGFQFVACLTHDVDHPSIRQHGLDHTIAGFLLRSTIGSLIDAVLGRMRIRDATKNWAAAIKLPFVYMGLAKDFWRDFDDRYLQLEKDTPSTFFVIPRKGDPGKGVDGRAKALRASRYEARELADTISTLQAAGREVGLHGIDAWLDSSAGREELDEIRLLTGVTEIGVRMHWLYFNENSPEMLERAGAAYDSTSGYNETIGYRAGTTQVFKLLGAERLLELPLHAMDTALFYLSYLGLSPCKASARLGEMANQVVRFGGCLTINWHDRSLAPERLWGGCYRQLIQDLKSRGAWIATAGQAVSWFRKRRSATFEMDPSQPGGMRAHVAADQDDNLPGLRWRIDRGRELREVVAQGPERLVNVSVDETFDAGVQWRVEE
jgi:hypothetical protein